MPCSKAHIIAFECNICISNDDVEPLEGKSPKSHESIRIHPTQVVLVSSMSRSCARQPNGTKELVQSTEKRPLVMQRR